MTFKYLYEARRVMVLCSLSFTLLSNNNYLYFIVFLALLSPIIPISPQSVGVVPIMFPTQDRIGSIKREDGDFKPSYDRLYSHDIPYSTRDLCCHNNVHIIHGDSGHSAVDKVNFRHSGMRTCPYTRTTYCTQFTVRPKLKVLQYDVN